MKGAGRNRDPGRTAKQVLRPIMPPSFSRRGAMVFWFLEFWLLFWVLASMVFSSASSGVEGGWMPNVPMAGVALLGAAVLAVILVGWRLPGIRRLYLSPPPLAVITPTELELHIPSVGVRRYRWEEIGELVRGPRRTGILRSPTGENLESIPPHLLQGNWRSLAQMVVRARGDRYLAVRSWRFGPRLFFASRPTPEQTFG
jgi:hypothetical protein